MASVIWASFESERPMFSVLESGRRPMHLLETVRLRDSRRALERDIELQDEPNSVFAAHPGGQAENGQRHRDPVSHRTRCFPPPLKASNPVELKHKPQLASLELC